MTKEQEKRTIQAMAETQRTLDRATRYSPQHRDQKLIAFCESHIEKLTAMLAAAH